MSRKTPTKHAREERVACSSSKQLFAVKPDDLSAEDSGSSIGRLLPTLVSPLQQHRLSCQEPFSQPDLTEYQIQDDEDSEDYE